jgi:hypothetical protein
MTCCLHSNQSLVDDSADEYLPKTLVSINYYIVGIGGFVMFLLGMITNTLNLVLLTRKSMKSTTNRYLASLAVCDICVLVFSTIITSNSLINDYGLIEAKAMERVNAAWADSLATNASSTADIITPTQFSSEESRIFCLSLNLKMLDFFKSAANAKYGWY